MCACLQIKLQIVQMTTHWERPDAQTHVTTNEWHSCVTRGKKRGDMAAVTGERGAGFESPSVGRVVWSLVSGNHPCPHLLTLSRGCAEA